jgi:aerobic carbon-monoxide dehydrogenase medium subunit
MIETVHTPGSLAEALALLHDGNGETRPLAGGQSLLVLLRHGLVDARALVALAGLAELHGIEPRDGGLRIGALVTQRELEASPVLARDFPALRDAAAAVASTQVRNKGTLGGNLCHADPSADPPAALIALGAEVEIAGVGGSRRLPVEAFFTSLLTTVLEPGELLTAIHLPAPRPRSAYLKHSLRGIDAAIVGVGVALDLDAAGGVRDARVGLAGVGPTPLRAVAAEATLRGRVWSDATLRAAAEAAADECRPLDDLEASAGYRRRLVRAYLERAARRAFARSA